MTYIGFDHHRKWTQAAAIDDQENIIREMRVLNDSTSLKGFLKGLSKPLKGVIEAGPTWGWIYDTLSDLGVKRVVANPSAVRAIAEAKIKRDKIDARMLASLLRVGLIPEVYVPTEEVRTQKMLWRERVWVVRMMVRLKNRIHRLLTHHHVTVPEFTDLFGTAGRRFLEKLELPEPGNRILKAQLKLLESYRLQIAEVQRWAVKATQGHLNRAYLTPDRFTLLQDSLLKNNHHSTEFLDVCGFASIANQHSGAAPYQYKRNIVSHRAEESECRSSERPQ